MEPGFAASEIDTSKPHPARMYDAYLGGKDNYAADREAVGQILRTWPEVRDMARANRAFMQRAVRFLAGEAGVRQFVDIGTGIPSAGNVHEVAIEVPEDIVERVRTLCLALPEVTLRVDGSLIRTRSTAHSFDIRRRSFCLLVAREGPAGKPVPLLVLRADPDEREALLSIGRPFFASRAGRDRIGVLLTDDTDWEEIRELVTESYRILAPKKLTALLD
jgi:hypothetical protein